MAQSVSELPNQNFISYLSKYGLNSNLQFDEYVSKAARDLGIDAFDFNLPLIERYREETMGVNSICKKFMRLCWPKGASDHPVRS